MVFVLRGETLFLPGVLVVPSTATATVAVELPVSPEAGELPEPEPLPEPDTEEPVELPPVTTAN